MISASQVQNAIARVDVNHVRGTGTVVCCLVLFNGHVVVGEAHCADLSKFDPVKGLEYARADAESKVLGLLVFAQRGEIC